MHIDLFAELNPEQQRAVKTTDGPVLILAGAGSGKTKTLTHRVAYLIEQGLAEPQNILAVTFTNKAAREMRERVAKILGANADHRDFMPYMGTFHSICVRILRIDGDYIGLNNKFVIFDEADRQTVIKQISKQLKIDEKKYPARAVARNISSAKNEMVTPEIFSSTAASPIQKVTATIFPLYERTLKEQGALDFDDLIGRVVEMLSTNKTIRSKWQNQFRYILIDEYQDTNATQYALIKLLTNKDNNICVVGDDWQSVYSFRGADFRNILNFERDFPKSTIIKLEQNYRSTKNILDAAHAVITKNKLRSDKKLWTAAGVGKPVQITHIYDERAEGETITRRIQTIIDTQSRRYQDFALLYRTNAQSRSLEEQFIRRAIPYKIVGGVRFYDRAEVKDVVAYMRLIYQPEDLVSFGRIINVPTRGLGPKSIQNFLDWRQTNGVTLDEAFNHLDQINLTPKAKNAFKEFAITIRNLRSISEEVTVDELLNCLLDQTGYLKYLEDGSIQGETRVENVRELESVAKGFAGGGLSSFLEEIALISDLDGLSESQDAVTLMTLHSAKGLEFPIVFMPGMEEGLMPHSQSISEQSGMEEERRLCYVGMTRAREELHLFYTTQRILYGVVQHNPPSRFLSDIDSEFITQSSSIEQQQIATMPDSFTGKITNEPRYVLELNAGDQVRHQYFGVGVVIEVEGENAAIQFKNKGTMMLNLTFAPLEKL